MNLTFKPQAVPPEERPIQIVLASQSVGRRTLMEKLGLPFRPVVTNIIEETIVDKDPTRTVKRRAAAKADDIIKNPRVYMLPAEGRSLVIAADSMAILGKKAFGKPGDKNETRDMLKQLMGKTHIFTTAMKIIYLQGHTVKKTWETVTRTKVTMRKMNTVEMESYLARYDFSRFAAAYALNELPWDLVTKLDGSYTNVIGLPFESLLPVIRSLKMII